MSSDNLFPGFPQRGGGHNSDPVPPNGGTREDLSDEAWQIIEKWKASEVTDEELAQVLTPEEIEEARSHIQEWYGDRTKVGGEETRVLRLAVVRKFGSDAINAADDKFNQSDRPVL
jgi:hypothetical protein